MLVYKKTQQNHPLANIVIKADVHQRYKKSNIDFCVQNGI